MDPIEQALDQAGIVGQRHREELALQLRGSLLARRGREALRLTGAPGTGKSLAAEATHRLAATELGRRGPLVRLDCATVDDAGLARALFSDGLVERAEGGTLLLDEVQSLPHEAQGRLLSLLSERRYRTPSGESRSADLLVVLAAAGEPEALLRDGRLRRELLERAPAKLALAPLFRRREDVGELAQHFTKEALAERGFSACLGLTRRALADVEAKITEAEETSVRRLRELARDVVFALASEPEAIESSAVAPWLAQGFGAAPTEASRAADDREDLQERFALVVEAAALRELAELHGLPEAALLRLARAVRELKASFPTDGSGAPASYRNLMAKTQLATKAALWAVSGAKNQAEFRRFFGEKSFQMPPKSVAWQIFHDLYGARGGHDGEDA